MDIGKLPNNLPFGTNRQTTEYLAYFNRIYDEASREMQKRVRNPSRTCPNKERSRSGSGSGSSRGS